MFPNENSVSLPVFTTCSLKRFISCNSDISVETVIIIGNTFFLWENHYLNVFLQFRICFAMIPLSSINIVSPCFIRTFTLFPNENSVSLRACSFYGKIIIPLSSFVFSVFVFLVLLGCLQ